MYLHITGQENGIKEDLRAMVHPHLNFLCSLYQIAWESGQFIQIRLMPCFVDGGVGFSRAEYYNGTFVNPEQLKALLGGSRFVELSALEVYRPGEQVGKTEGVVTQLEAVLQVESMAINSGVDETDISIVLPPHTRVVRLDQRGGDKQ